MELKIAFFIIVISVSNVFATPSYSQVAKVSLNMENKSLEQVMDEIESQSEFYFIFNQKQIDVNRVVSIQEENRLITDILPELFKGTNVNYAIIDRKILLTTDPLENDLLSIILGTEQQQNRVTGTVTGKDGTPVPGANVVVTGTTLGTITDVAGKYSIEVPQGSKSLTFSFIGMESQEISIGTLTQINVTMAESAIGLEEVVVVGYGTQKKTSVTGAISTMKTEDVRNMPISKLSNAIAGQLSGVFVTQASGAPGYAASIRIRAINTWKSSGLEPLYVIDGIISDKRTFDALDFTEVDNITVLKDASSGAIYGARAANGVILVTTRTGAEGKFQLNYNYSYSFDKPTQLPKYVDMKDQVLLNNYERVTAGIEPLYDEKEIAYFTEHDPGKAWYSLAYRAPVLQKHSLTASGGAEKVKYFLSGSYFDQTAFVKNADYKKYNFRSNINVDFTKNLSGIFNISYNQGVNERFVFQEDLSGLNINPDFGSLWARLLVYLPYIPPKTSDGKFVNPGWIGNPLAFIEEGGTNTRVERNVNMNIGVTYKIPFVDGLSVSARYSPNYEAMTMKQYELKPTIYNVVKLGSHGRIYTDSVIGSVKSAYPNKERLAKVQEATNSYQLNLSANYVKKFGNNNVDALFVYEQSEGNYDYFYGVREGFPLLQKDQFWATSSNRLDSYVDGNESENGRASYIGRISYNYAEKYFINVTTRRDGSMLFGPSYRWGTFPSVSAGWVISKEDFFNVESIDFLKLRGSWGLAGNDAVGGWKWQESYSTSGNYLFGTTPQPRIRFDGIINKSLTWEKTSEFNIGLDSRLFKGFLFNADYYKRHNYDILDSRIASTPVSFGGTLPPVNYGIVDAQGFEFELGYDGFFGKLAYGVKGNFGYATNIVKLRDVAQNVQKVDDPNGRSTDYMRMLVATGIIRTQAELDALPANYTIYGLKPLLGSINYEDVSGLVEGVPDGKIDDWDRQVLKGKHSRAPYTFGLNLHANWKGFGADLLMQGITGISKDSRQDFRECSEGQARYDIYWLDSWSAENINSSYPKVSLYGRTNDSQQSTFWLENGSFLRLQFVNLTYSLPKSICQKIRISDVTFILSGTNLFTLTEYKKHDPNVSSMRSYPTMKSYTMGANITF